MMLTVRSLHDNPAVFTSLTGLKVAVFDTLLPEVVTALAAADQARLSHPGRRRAIGGGHPYA